MKKRINLYFKIKTVGRIGFLSALLFVDVILHPHGGTSSPGGDSLIRNNSSDEGGRGRLDSGYVSYTKPKPLSETKDKTDKKSFFIGPSSIKTANMGYFTKLHFVLLL